MGSNPAWVREIFLFLRVGPFPYTKILFRRRFVLPDEQVVQSPTKITFRRTNWKFARRAGTELSKEAINFGKFSWKVNMAGGKKAAKKRTRKKKEQIVTVSNSH